MNCSLITNELLVFCRIKEMSSTRETSRAVPNGCRCQMGQNGQIGHQASLVPMELRRTDVTIPSTMLQQRPQRPQRPGNGECSKYSPVSGQGDLVGAGYGPYRTWHSSCRCCFTQVAATPLVISLRFQTGTRSTDTTVDANASVGNVRLESEVLVLALWGLD